MQSGELFISNRDGVHQIRVTGKATFECAPGLRNFAKSLEQDTYKSIRIDLRECVWMDSTFMGILAMIGLHAKKVGAEVAILNAGPQNTALLCGLGLKKLFKFEDTAESGSAGERKADDKAESALDSARMVLDAHETLMNVDEGNVRKFNGVVDLVRKDIEKQDGTQKS